MRIAKRSAAALECPGPLLGHKSLFFGEGEDKLDVRSAVFSIFGAGDKKKEISRYSPVTRYFSFRAFIIPLTGTKGYSTYHSIMAR